MSAAAAGESRPARHSLPQRRTIRFHWVPVAVDPPCCPVALQSASLASNRCRPTDDVAGIVVVGGGRDGRTVILGNTIVTDCRSSRSRCSADGYTASYLS